MNPKSTTMKAQALTERMAKGLPIHFGSCVRMLRYDAHGVEIVCADGRTWHADVAICTVSLGVLKVGVITWV